MRRTPLFICSSNMIPPFFQLYLSSCSYPYIEKAEDSHPLLSPIKKIPHKREEAGKRGILPALSMKKSFMLKKVFTLFTSINIPNECEDYLMKM